MPPEGAKGGPIRSFRASEKAEIPVLEVNAMAEKFSREDLFSRRIRSEVLVARVVSTATVGHQRGCHLLRRMR